MKVDHRSRKRGAPHYGVVRRAVSTKSNGTGFGLAIARKVVEAHGGTIEAHKSPLGGARFELRFPVSATLPRASRRWRESS